MSDYSFLKTGFSNVSNETNVDTNTLEMIFTLLQIFQEDSLITAGKYAIGCKRNNVTAIDLKKALMYQAQNFFDQGESLEERFEKYMREREEYMDDDSDYDEDEDETPVNEDGDEDETLVNEDGDEDETLVNEDGDEELKYLVFVVDKIYTDWDTWCPTDPIKCLIKKSIDNVPV